jgi:hypothetical protein
VPIERYRDVAEMPRPPRPKGVALWTAIAAAWQRGFIRARPPVPRGVHRFRNVEEAHAARIRLTFELVQSLRRKI